MNKVLSETIKAYADCNGGEHADRNLSYRATEPLTALQWMETMAAALGEEGTYNEFDATVAKKIVDTFGHKALYYPAREGSVCVYVKPYGQPEVNIAEADEVDHDPQTQEWRIWFD